MCYLLSCVFEIRSLSLCIMAEPAPHVVFLHSISCPGAIPSSNLIFVLEEGRRVLWCSAVGSMTSDFPVSTLLPVLLLSIHLLVFPSPFEPLYLSVPSSWFFFCLFQPLVRCLSGASRMCTPSLTSGCPFKVSALLSRSGTVKGIQIIIINSIPSTCREDKGLYRRRGEQNLSFLSLQLRDLLLGQDPFPPFSPLSFRLTSSSPRYDTCRDTKDIHQTGTNSMQEVRSDKRREMRVEGVSGKVLTDRQDDDSVSEVQRID